ncbi:MAG: hypothetical protein FWE58_02815 [Methanobrevibacter sp.]|nr:hypothetical protein [Methanobrevibacter sp.]
MIEDDDEIPIIIKSSISKAGIFIGILMIVMAITWIASKLGLIPPIIFDMWPQIALIVIGIFIVYKSL